MSRAPLGDTVTVVKKFKLPAEQADAYARRCDELGFNQSDQLRTLVARWLLQTDALARLKKQSTPGGKTA